MFVCITDLYELLKSLRDHVNNLFYNIMCELEYIKSFITAIFI